MNHAKITIQILCLSFLIFTSCEKGNEATPTTSQQKQAVGPDGKITLASFVHSSGAQTDFYQLSNSSIVIQVTFPADNNPSIEAQKEYTGKIHEMVAAKKNYDYIYSTLTGDKVNKENLDAIKSAGLLYKKALENASAANVKATQFQTTRNYVASSDAANGRTETCARDYYNDDYGANWFARNYCTFCELSQSGLYYYVPSLPSDYEGYLFTNERQDTRFPFSRQIICTSFFDVYVMAAAFDSDAAVTLSVIDNYANLLGSFQVPPRHISFLSYGYQADIVRLWVTGNTACSRFHYSQLDDWPASGF